ncbi:MAG: SOS response-associated peptidase [Hyphomicrobiaceae bacterium]
MCSRYSLTSPPEAVRQTFGYRETPNFPPRYNIAPTQPVAIVRRGADGVREFALVRWGLIPSWVKDPGEFRTLINARSETALEKPSFRAGIRHRRCLVPADGFYEWTGPKGNKQPHLIRPRTEGPMAFAGIWEHWMGPDGSELESMAILTTAANETVQPLHDRMPVILEPENFALWLDVRDTPAKEAAEFLRPANDDLLQTREVSRALNNPRNDGPEVQDAPEGQLL